MPLAALLFFLFSGSGPARFHRIEPFLTADCPQECGPSWGILRNSSDLKAFAKVYFKEAALPDVDFDRETVLFLVPGPEEGRYGHFRFSRYRAGRDGGVVVCCEKGREKGGVQLVKVPRFDGQAVFCFGELP
jgi:hypothetical protein